MGLCPAAAVLSRPQQVLVPGWVTSGLACTAEWGDGGLGWGYLPRACVQAQGGDRSHRLWVYVCRRPATRDLHPQPHMREAAGQGLLSGGECGLLSLQPLPSG